MVLIDKPQEWTKALDACRSKGQLVGLVPTMGALHGGHQSLISRAAADCDVVAVTDYVNPLQFGPGEDLERYPRDLARDCELAEQAGADLMFAPTVDALWPRQPLTAVTVAGLTEVMEGERRPGHFRGVTTIVAKLLCLSGPCWAYFGEKDYQQLVVLKRMVEDLSLPVAVVACPTVRDSDGLALSSRNAYLEATQLAAAPTLYASLLAAKRSIEDDGILEPEEVKKVFRSRLAAEPLFELEYVAVADPEDLTVPDLIVREVRVLAAARLGSTRLIDNVAARPPEPLNRESAPPDPSCGEPET